MRARVMLGGVIEVEKGKRGVVKADVVKRDAMSGSAWESE